MEIEQINNNQEQITEWKKNNKDKLMNSIKKWQKKESYCEACNKMIKNGSRYIHVRTNVHIRNLNKQTKPETQEQIKHYINEINKLMS